MSGSDNEVVAIPKVFRCYADTKANLDLLPGLKTGDIGFGTDTVILYRWNGAAWSSIASTNTLRVITGTYTGDSTVNRFITHNLYSVPKIIIIFCESLNSLHMLFTNIGSMFFITPTIGSITVTNPNATNFYVGNAANYINSANLNASNYYYVIIGG